MGVTSRMRDGLANSNVEISCHLVDIKMSMDPAGTQGSGAVLTFRLSRRSSFYCSLENDILQSVLHSQTLLDVQKSPDRQGQKY